MVETNRAEESPIKKMDSKRIKEIQQETAHSESVSVQQALLKVWNECAQQSQSEIDELTKEVERLRNLNKRLFTLWENLYEAGEISISKNFSTSFNEIRESINNLKK